MWDSDTKEAPTTQRVSAMLGGGKDFLSSDLDGVGCTFQITKDILSALTSYVYLLGVNDISYFIIFSICIKICDSIQNHQWIFLLNKRILFSNSCMKNSNMCNCSG